MNIFYLDDNPKTCAMAMTDKHVVKMIVESAQLLSTAHHLLGGTATYRMTHKNHPSAVWTRETLGNYLWLHRHLYFLLDEYAKRYNKTPQDHATYKIWEELKKYPPNIVMDMRVTPIKIAITNNVHVVQNNGIMSYRRYYVAEKLKNEKDIERYKKIMLDR